MPACSGGDSDDSVRPLFNGLPRKAVVNDIVKGDATPFVNSLIDVFPRAERRDDDRNPPRSANFKVFFNARIGTMNDLVHRKGRRRHVGIIPIPSRQLFDNLMQLFVQLRLRTGVERREGAHNAGLAPRDDEFWTRDDKHRRADDRQS